MSKRLVAALGTVTITVGLLAGCGGGSKPGWMAPAQSTGMRTGRLALPRRTP